MFGESRVRPNFTVFSQSPKVDVLSPWLEQESTEKKFSIFSKIRLKETLRELCVTTFFSSSIRISGEMDIKHHHRYPLPKQQVKPAILLSLFVRTIREQKNIIIHFIIADLEKKTTPRKFFLKASGRDVFSEILPDYDRIHHQNVLGDE